MATTSLEDILATREKTRFRHRINFVNILPENQLLMEEWCRTNCHDTWRSHNNYAIYFQFENEKDATMFMLRWGNAYGNQLQ